MDQQKKQRRVSFSDLLGQEKHEQSRRISKDRTKSMSFREAIFDDKEMAKILRNYNNNGKESELAASIAAAAYAIHSLDETRAEYERTMVESFRESFRDPPTQDQQGTFDLTDLRILTRGSSRIERKGEGIMRSSTRVVEVEGPVHRSGKREDTQANAWERARMAKINKWYEKMNSKILEWEKEKKNKAGFDMERKKAELERLERLNLYHYENKVDRIENVSQGARKQLEEKKISDEAYVKQRANKIRSTGTVPVQCFCFEY